MLKGHLSQGKGYGQGLPCHLTPQPSEHPSALCRTNTPDKGANAGRTEGGACGTIPSPPTPSPAGLPPPLPTMSPPHRREGAKVCGGNSPLPSLGAVILKEEQMGALAWMQHRGKCGRSPSADVPGGAGCPPPPSTAGSSRPPQSGGMAGDSGFPSSPEASPTY